MVSLAHACQEVPKGWATWAAGYHPSPMVACLCHQGLGVAGSGQQQSWSPDGQCESVPVTASPSKPAQQRGGHQADHRALRIHSQVPSLPKPLFSARKFVITTYELVATITINLVNLQFTPQGSHLPHHFFCIQKKL